MAAQLKTIADKYFALRRVFPSAWHLEFSVHFSSWLVETAARIEKINEDFVKQWNELDNNECDWSTIETDDIHVVTAKIDYSRDETGAPRMTSTTSTRCRSRIEYDGRLVADTPYANQLKEAFEESVRMHSSFQLLWLTDETEN